ncbi:MAG: SMP-30/gluconolactonase/LRE family protein [Lautropia sp.]
MFAPPELIPAELVARMPESLHLREGKSPRFGSRKHYLEGPAVARDGTLYFTDVAGGRILRLEPDGEISVFLEYDGEPNGMKIHKDGRFFVADNKRGIIYIDPISKKISTFVDRLHNERMRGPNDLVFADNGDLYFTDQGNSDLQRPHGRVIRTSPDGASDVLVTGIPSPNGLVLGNQGAGWLDHTFLFIAVTRENTVWRTVIYPDGHIDRTGVYIHFSGGGGPDGMAVDQNDNLIVAHSGFGCAWVFDSKGEPIYRINSCTGGLGVSNVSFGGSDHRTLYITESVTGSVMTARMPVPGQKLYSHL